MAQSEEFVDEIIRIEISLSKLKAIDEALQKKLILEKLVESQQKTIDQLESSLADEKKTNELNQREIYLQTKMLELKDQEITIERQTSDRLKEVTDRAIKLAEASKLKFEWWYMIPVIGWFALVLAH